MSTYQGWNVVTIPGTPAAPRDIEAVIDDATAISISPFTGQQQVYYWGKLPRQLRISLPPLTDSVAQEWISFLVALKGQAGVFQFGAAICAKYPLTLTSDGTTPIYWRLADNKRGWSINDNRFYGIQFNVREAK